MIIQGHADLEKKFFIPPPADPHFQFFLAALYLHELERENGYVMCVRERRDSSSSSAGTLYDEDLHEMDPPSLIFSHPPSPNPRLVIELEREEGTRFNLRDCNSLLYVSPRFIGPLSHP